MPRISIAWCSRASPASSSTSTCAATASSSRSIRAPTPRWAAWPPPAPPAPMRCATAPCATNVVNLTVVMADATVVKTAGRAKKSSAGYDLTRLLVGSEGTLGVITELTLRLHGIPEAIAGGAVPFASVEDACNATILTIQSGIPVARIELLDALMVKASNLYSKLALAETPTLFVEFHGSEAGVREQSAAFGEIVRGVRRRRVRLGAEAGGAQPPLAGPPRCLLGRAGAPPRLPAGGDRCLRAHLAPRRMRHRDRGGCRGERHPRAHRRPRRRREFPPHHPRRSGRPRRGGADRGGSSAGSISAPSPWRAPAPASTASARAR